MVRTSADLINSRSRRLCVVSSGLVSSLNWEIIGPWSSFLSIFIIVAPAVSPDIMVAWTGDEPRHLGKSEG